LEKRSIFKLYEDTLLALDHYFGKFEARVPRPRLKPWRHGWVYRYEEKTIHQAVILKLARMISSVRAAYLLFQNGFVQEQATIQRVLDEIDQDISFLLLAITVDTETELHQRFLTEFFQEEFDEGLDVVEAPQKRHRIQTKKIRAYIARVQAQMEEQAGGKPNPSRSKQVSDTIANAYSGYVHAAAVHTMEMYGGYPPKFHLNGMLGTPRMEEHANDLRNYFCRALMAMALASHAFGDREDFRNLREMVKLYETLDMEDEE
jgi:hypothetical protein